ncbi:hypothetical protein GBA52_026613 [Prunus armeniaca]|nr:hypothetical protein GBA52_026613 [Prunus armeniaca]
MVIVRVMKSTPEENEIKYTQPSSRHSCSRGKNCPVRCSTLIRQWIAEGFIQEQRGKTLEEVAEEYLAELIQRSLVQVSYVDERGVRRECQVHDVMREAVILLKTRDMSFSQFLEEDSRFNENSRHLSVVVVDPEAYTYDDQVIKKAEATGKPGLVDIIAKEDSFIFTVESNGAVKASQLLLNAIEVLNQKLDAVRLSEDTVEADDQFGELGAHMRGG